MTFKTKATRIRLADFTSVPMRAFHMSWFAFFICFFGWFGLAPLMPVIRQEFHLTKAQIGNLTIASVAIAVVVRGFDRLPLRSYRPAPRLYMAPHTGPGDCHPTGRLPVCPPHKASTA